MNLAATDYARMIQALIETAQVVTHEGVSLGIDAGCRQAVEMVLALAPVGRKVMVIGNGGSAAIASHMVNDLAKAANLRAMTFNDMALITALANDEGYDRAYEACVEQWAQAGDLLIAISSSGQSTNMLRAVAAARAAGAHVITLTGFRSDNPLRRRGDLNLYINAEHYGLVELCHAMLTHHLTDAVAAARVSQAVEENTHDIHIDIDPDIAFPAPRADHRRGRLRRSRVSA